MVEVPHTLVTFADHSTQLGVLELRAVTSSLSYTPELTDFSAKVKVGRKSLLIPMLPRTQILQALASELVRFRTARYVLQAQLDFEEGGPWPTDAGDILTALCEMPLKGYRDNDARAISGKLLQVKVQVAESGRVDEVTLELTTGDAAISLRKYYDQGLPWSLHNEALVDLVLSQAALAKRFFDRYPKVTSDMRFQLHAASLVALTALRRKAAQAEARLVPPHPHLWRNRCLAAVVATGGAVAGWFIFQEILEFLF